MRIPPCLQRGIAEAASLLGACVATPQPPATRELFASTAGSQPAEIVLIVYSVFKLAAFADDETIPAREGRFSCWRAANGTDGDYYRGADRSWAFGSGAGGSYVLWNHRFGIVFAGFGVETGPASSRIPHTIEACIARPDPLAGERP